MKTLEERHPLNGAASSSSPDPSPPAAAEPLVRLAEALEQVRRSCPTPVVDAVTWLHLKHPLDSPQKNILRGSVPLRLKRRFPSRVLQAMRLGLYALYLCLRLLQMRLKYFRWLHPLRRRSFDLVLKTWRFHPDRTPEEDDFYFGDLCHRLKEAGVSVLRLFGNPNGRPWEGPAPRTGAAVLELPEWCLVPLGAPVGLLRQIFRASAHLRKAATSHSDPLTRSCLLQASEDCLQARFLPVALYASLGETVARVWAPRLLLTLYEGHAWEQCLWKGFRRRMGENSRIAGYQHTVLFPYQMALLKPGVGDRASKPDWLLCLGQRTCQMLEASHPGIPRFVFGTFRKLPGTRGRAQGVAPPARKTVLVLPEGHRAETVRLFAFALEAARQLTDHHFVLRCHPLLPMEKVRSDLSADLLAFPNVEVSSRRIEEDFLRSSLVLYRGSSTVLYAILFGLKPFYLHREGEEVIDPLFELDAWREQVASLGALSLRFRHHADCLPTDLWSDWERAKAYVESYLVPVTNDSVRLLLNAISS